MGPRENPGIICNEHATWPAIPRENPRERFVSQQLMEHVHLASYLCMLPHVTGVKRLLTEHQVSVLLAACTTEDGQQYKQLSRHNYVREALHIL